jgi:hypothetical protein
MTWTKFSERLPEESQEQVHMAIPNGKVSTTRRNPGNPWADYYGRDLQPAAMWHPITYPELPKEETQEEKDRDACHQAWVGRGIDYMHDSPGSVSEDYRMGFHAALAYERAEVAKHLRDIEIAPNQLGMAKIINRLRKRCGLDK